MITAFNTKYGYWVEAKDVYVKTVNVWKCTVNAIKIINHVENNVVAKDARIINNLGKRKKTQKI